MRVEDFTSKTPLNKDVFVSEAIFSYAHASQLLLFGRMHNSIYRFLAHEQFSSAVRKGLSVLVMDRYPLADFSVDFKESLIEAVGNLVDHYSFGGWVIKNKRDLPQPVMLKTLIHFKNALPPLIDNTIPGWKKADMDDDLDLFKRDGSDEALAYLIQESPRRYFGLMLTNQLVALVETFVEMMLPYDDSKTPIESFLKK